MGNCLSICCCSVKAAVFPELQNTFSNTYKQELRQKEVEITTVRVIDTY